MKLRNNFSTDTRWLFHDHRFKCADCGGNGQNKGGTSLHHILGRCSNSPYNGIVLCGSCHSRCGHADEEQGKYLKITKGNLDREHYKPTEDDLTFLKENENYYD